MQKHLVLMLRLMMFIVSLGSLSAWAIAPVESLNPSDYRGSTDIQQGRSTVQANNAVQKKAVGENKGSLDVHGNSNMIGNLLNKINELQKQIQIMKGDIEVQAHAIKTMENQSKQRYMDIDRRLSRLVTEGMGQKRSVTNKDNKESVAQNIETMPDDNQAYQSAFALIGEQKFQEAADAFKSFTVSYPKSRYVANAWYWMGEIYSASGKPNDALKAFLKVVSQYSNSSKVADAMYKLGIINAQQGNKAEAKKYLQKVISQYPDSSAATLSKSYLQTMN